MSNNQYVILPAVDPEHWDRLDYMEYAPDNNATVLHSRSLPFGRVVCHQHKVEACGHCYVDFGLLNHLLPQALVCAYDRLPQRKRQRFIAHEVNGYFENPTVAISNPTGKLNPVKLQRLLEEIFPSLAQTCVYVSFWILKMGHDSYQQRFADTHNDNNVVIKEAINQSAEVILAENINPIKGSWSTISPCALVTKVRTLRVGRWKLQTNEALGWLLNTDHVKPRGQWDLERLMNALALLKLDERDSHEYEMMWERIRLCEAVENILGILGDNHFTDEGGFINDIVAILCEGTGYNSDKSRAISRKDSNIQLRHSILLLTRYRQILVDHSKDTDKLNHHEGWSKKEALEFLRRHKLVLRYRQDCCEAGTMQGTSGPKIIMTPGNTLGTPPPPIPEMSVIQSLVHEMLRIVEASRNILRMDDKNMVRVIVGYRQWEQYTSNKAIRGQRMTR